MVSDWDSKIVDVDEVNIADFKINPDYYIHTALLKAQESLASDNTKVGFLKYVIFVEHIETLCKAAKIVADKYNTAVKDFMNSKEYSDADEGVKGVRLANKKLGLMMDAVFSSKTIVDDLTL